MKMIFKLLSYPRALLIALFIPLWTLICSVIVFFVILSTGKKESAAYVTSHIWCKTILFLTGVQVTLQGGRDIPSSGFLYVFNHTSHYDIFAAFAVSPRYFYFGAKSELFAIPIFGHAVRLAGALPIERKNRSKVMQVYKEAEARVQKGDVFALAPEGTRRNGFGKLGDFKSGPFFFAVNAQMPIVPMVIVGCEKVMPKHALLPGWGNWSQKVVIELLSPIYPQGRDEAQVPDLKEKTRVAMQASLDKHWK